LFRPKRDRQLVNPAGELEWHLVVLVVHRRTSVDPNIERVGPPDADRQTLGHGVAIEDLAIQLQRAGTTLAHARTVLLPVEFEGVLTRRKRALALPLHALKL